MDVENSSNAKRSLEYIKNELGINPEIIVHDLSPNLIKATCDIYGAEKMAFDPFHVMQSVNRAIGKELSKYREKRFIKEKNELFALRKYISKLQKEYKEHYRLKTNFLKEFPKIDKKHVVSVYCAEFTKQILSLLKIDDYFKFFSDLKTFLAKYKKQKNLKILAFALSIEDKLPKKRFTQKSHQRIIIELLKKLKTFYHDCRIPIEEEQKRFSKTRWLLFYQPEKLTEKRIELLNKFLTKYPELQRYRDLTLHFGSIYRLPLDMVSDSLILDVKMDENYGKDLCTCLKTFKKYHGAILRFRDFFIRNPTLTRRSRANMEYQNRNVKSIFKSGNNLKGMNRIENELKLHLGGEVRNFITCT